MSGKLKPLDVQREEKPGKYADGDGLYAFADSDEPKVIDVFDQILETVKRSDWPLRRRLLEVSRLAAIVRDNGRSVQ